MMTLSELEKRKAELIDRRDNLRREAGRLESEAARALTAADKERWDALRKQRASSVAELHDLARAIAVLDERIETERRAEFSTAATARAQALKRAAGGSRGEVPRAVERAVEQFELSLKHFERAVELAREVDRCALEARLLTCLAGVDPVEIDQLQYGAWNVPFRALEGRVTPVVYRGQVRLKTLNALERAVSAIARGGDVSNLAGVEISEETRAVLDRHPDAIEPEPEEEPAEAEEAVGAA